MSVALPRHMFCGGPDYSPAVVLTLARADSSSINTHTHTHTLSSTNLASSYRGMTSPGNHSLRQTKCLCHQKKEERGGKEGRGEEKKGGAEPSCAEGSMFSTAVRECGLVILAGRPRGSGLWKLFVSEESGRQQAEPGGVGWGGGGSLSSLPHARDEQADLFCPTWV